MTDQLINLGTSALIILVAFLLSRLSRWLTRQLGERIAGRTRNTLDDVLVNSARGPLQAIILIFGLEIAINRLQFIPDSWGDDISRLTFSLYALFIYIFFYRLVGGAIIWYGKSIARKTPSKLDDKFLHLFRRIALLTLSVVVIITVLGRYGIEVSALVTTLGIGSLAIALAAQETLGDMISGFTIMLDQPFKVGDRVEIQAIDTWGDVTEIGLRSTRIITRDNRMVTVPNSVIGKGMVVNHSVPSTMYRVETHVGVAYGSDIEYARQVMIEAIRAQEWVMQDKPIEALMLQFGDSALIFRVRCWIEHFVETRRIIDKMNTALYIALNEAKIIIPMPQRELRFNAQKLSVQLDGSAGDDS